MLRILYSPNASLNISLPSGEESGIGSAGAIIPILELVQKEVEARRFRQAVLEAAPLLDKFVEALYRDANLFREHRATFLNYRFKFEEESFVVEEAMEFRRLLNSRLLRSTL